MRFKNLEFSELTGLSIRQITVCQGGKGGLSHDGSEPDITGDYVRFETYDGRVFLLLHLQDCCEEVYIESIVGDTLDLLNTPITTAEEVENASEEKRCTWTFYRVATAKGMVVIRWLGQSNGYYSERVSFMEMLPPLQ